MILDRTQVVWCAVAEFYLVEIRKLFWDNQRPTLSRFSVRLPCSAEWPSYLSLTTASATGDAPSPALGIYLLICLLLLAHLLHKDSIPRCSLVDVFHSCSPDLVKERRERAPHTARSAGGPQHFLGIANVLWTCEALVIVSMKCNFVKGRWRVSRGVNDGLFNLSRVGFYPEKKKKN